MDTSEKRMSPHELLAELKELRQVVFEDAQKLYGRWEGKIQNEDFRESAKNLCAYLALRRHDITKLQRELSLLGLSSLGRLESRTLETIDAVICSLGNILNEEVDIYCYPSKKKFIGGKETLERNSERLFGPFPENRKTMIMVTMAGDMKYDDIEDLMRRGMNCARINAAHDNEEIWARIIGYIRKAEKELGQECRIMTDIAGPKVRIRWILSSVDKGKAQLGDHILLSNTDQIQFDPLFPIKIGVSVPHIVNKLKVDDLILFDDGSIEGHVAEMREEGAVIEVDKVVKENGVRIKIDKGLNFPQSDIHLDVLTEKDLNDLDFVVEHCDITSISFVNSAEDLDYAISEIRKRYQGEGPFSVVAKIESISGLYNLPEIIMTGASQANLGVMIARGDLAVELGYLRFAELQQEILWICEAADIPVIWATQVLETMAKTGIPSRAEVTDAAEGGTRSECVMLNKGPYIPDVVSFLDELLAVMRSNIYKKSSKLRALNLAKETFQELE